LRLPMVAISRNRRDRARRGTSGLLVAHPDRCVMSQQSVRVRAPATSANLGPGFDALGVALDWTAEIVVERGDRTGDAGEPSPDPATAAIERMATDAARNALRLAGERDVELRATYRGDLPVGRGLGMSAAARAAG